MKKIAALVLFALVHCSGDTMSGVDQTFLRSKFKLSKTAQVAIIDVEDGSSCPIVEFKLSNDETFQIRRGPGDPPLNQTTFTYAENEYSSDGAKQILTGSNDSNTTYEITYFDQIYSIYIDYECANSTDSECVKTTFNCSGPLQ